MRPFFENQPPLGFEGRRHLAGQQPTYWPTGDVGAPTLVEAAWFSGYELSDVESGGEKTLVEVLLFGDLADEDKMPERLE